MVGVVYDSIVFKTESEVGQNVQELIEGEIHIVAHGSSSLQDQATLIPERLAELEGLTDDVTSSSGIKVVDTVRWELSMCWCSCHCNRFSDFSHEENCPQRSLAQIQEIAIAGHFGKIPGHIKFYEELSTNQG